MTITGSDGLKSMASYVEFKSDVPLASLNKIFNKCEICHFNFDFTFANLSANL